MGLKIVVLALFQDTGGHVLVLEPHIGQQGRGQPPPQVHVPQPLQILGGDGVAAAPQGLEFSGRHGAQGGQEALRLGKEGGEGLRGQGVRIGPHLFCRGDEDLHSASCRLGRGGAGVLFVSYTRCGVFTRNFTGGGRSAILGGT